MTGVPYIADAPTAAIPLQQEAAALFARMTTAPSTARKALINETIYRLKQAGVWDNLVTLAIHAAHDEQAARLCWKNAAKNPTKTGSLTFTADLGYTAGWSGANYLEYPLTTAGDFASANPNTCWFLAAGEYDAAALTLGISQYAIVSAAGGTFTGTGDGIVMATRDGITGSDSRGFSFGYASAPPFGGGHGGVYVSDFMVGVGKPGAREAYAGGSVLSAVWPNGAGLNATWTAPSAINAPRTSDRDLGDHAAFGAMLPAATAAHAKALGVIITDYLYRLGAFA